jgi:hypothetical protein
VGHRATSTCHLGNVAYRTGKKIRWDPRKEQIPGDRKAARYLSRSYRKPWKLAV